MNATHICLYDFTSFKQFRQVLQGVKHIICEMVSKVLTCIGTKMLRCLNVVYCCILCLNMFDYVYVCLTIVTLV